MNLWKALPLLGGLALGTGCIGDDVGGDGDSGDTGTMTMTTASTMTTMTTAGEDTTMGMTMGGTADTTAGDDDDDDDDDDDESSSGGDDPNVFMFDETPPEDYTQQDRKGFPAINTGLNLLGDKDAYNASNPAGDLDGTAEQNAEDSLDYLHDGFMAMGNGLDDDLIGAGFDPCPTAGVGDCLEQAGPFAIPDTLNITVGGDAQFPNGRQPFEAVMDVILAVLLLDLGTHDLDAFLDLNDDGTLGDSLNPIQNDVAFPADWPHLAPPHEP